MSHYAVSALRQLPGEADMSKLYLVPTPIGNLEDMTFRGVRILKEVDFILAEDTRTSRHLLDHYQINTSLSPYHKFNEHKQVKPLLITNTTTSAHPKTQRYALKMVKHQNISTMVYLKTQPSPTHSMMVSLRYPHLGILQ